MKTEELRITTNEGITIITKDGIIVKRKEEE